MEKIKISEVFKREYLTCGKTYDNFIFLNCKKEVLDYIEKSLSKSSETVKSCVLTLKRQEEEFIEETLNLFPSEMHKKLIARDYICSKIMLELIKDDNEREAEADILGVGIADILNAKDENIKDFHAFSPIPSDITRFAKEDCKFELNIFLDNTQNIYLQQAINNFISSREPFSVKLFATQERLSTYCDQLGNFIQSPHDYINMNVNKFTENVDLEKN